MQLLRDNLVRKLLSSYFVPPPQVRQLLTFPQTLWTSSEAESAPADQAASKDESAAAEAPATTEEPKAAE